MARLPSISKAKLNTAVKQLPKPVRSHLKRCRLLAGYVMERIETEDWFIEAKLNAKNIVAAIGYHDIGKCSLQKEVMFLEHCTTAAAKKAYMSHPDEGIALVERECGVHLEDYRPTSFGGLLRQVIYLHHASLDGSGFPKGAPGDEELSLATKLCMVIDTFDNLVFVGKTGEPDVAGAIRELRSLSGKQLDTAAVEMLLGDELTLENFVLYIDKRERTGRRSDSEEYGVVLRYEPYCNILKQRVSGYRVRLLLHDPYYGLMKSDSFVQIAERTGQITKIEKAAFEKLCIYMEWLFENTEKKPRFIFDLSVQNFEKKNFVKDYLSILKQYQIPERTLCFAFKEADLLHTSGNWQDGLKQFKEAGIGIMIDNFGDASSLLPLFGELQVDLLGLKKNYTQNMTNETKTLAIVAGLARMARGLYVDVIASDVVNTRQEAEYQNMQVKYALGELYGAPMTFRELKKAYSDKPLAIGG